MGFILIEQILLRTRIYMVVINVELIILAIDRVSQLHSGYPIR